MSSGLFVLVGAIGLEPTPPHHVKDVALPWLTITLERPTGRGRAAHVTPWTVRAVLRHAGTAARKVRVGTWAAQERRFDGSENAALADAAPQGAGGAGGWAACWATWSHANPQGSASTRCEC